MTLTRPRKSDPLHLRVVATGCRRGRAAARIAQWLVFGSLLCGCRPEPEPTDPVKAAEYQLLLSSVDTFRLYYDKSDGSPRIQYMELTRADADFQTVADMLWSGFTSGCRRATPSVKGDMYSLDALRDGVVVLEILATRDEQALVNGDHLFSFTIQWTLDRLYWAARE